MPRQKQIFPEGKGLKSRKFILTIIALVLLVGMGVLPVFLPAAAGSYPTFIGGLIGILGLYFSGNVANKFVVGKSTVEFHNGPATVKEE
jgi:hypothetical protein